MVIPARSPFLNLAVTLWALSVACCATPAPNAPNNDGAEISLTIGQQGFAGESRTVWTTDASGHAEVSKFLGERPLGQACTGRLPGDVARKLQRTVADEDFQSLPETLGAASGANPETVLVSADGKTVRLGLHPGESLAAAQSRFSSDMPEQRILRIAVAIRSAIDGNLSC